MSLERLESNWDKVRWAFYVMSKHENNILLHVELKKRQSGESKTLHLTAVMHCCAVCLKNNLIHVSINPLFFDSNGTALKFESKIKQRTFSPSCATEMIETDYYHQYVCCDMINISTICY